MSIIEREIFAPGGLDESSLSTTLDSMLSHRIDEADLYFQLAQVESWSLEDGIVKSAGFSIDQGVGVRAVDGDKVGFAYSDDFTLDALQAAANSARAIAISGRAYVTKAFTRTRAIDQYKKDSPLSSLADDEKIALLRRVDAAARAADPAVIQVMASIAGSHEVILVAASDGTLASDIRPLVRLNVSVIVEKDGKRETGFAGGGGRHDYLRLAAGTVVENYAREAVRMAMLNLDAIAAPAGTMPVVLGSGWPGIMLHEAVGHGLEGDFNRKSTSTFSGRVGEQVASPLCTVVDDGTLPERRGSLSIDDEGTPGACNVLIENGVLKGFMQDKLNARLSGVAPTGNGRRESYAHLPMPRMTNTYMLAGESTPDEVIASLDKGIYAANFGGGQVDITSGKFVFSTSEAYLVEKGKIIAPVKGATLIGSGPEVMQHISMVADDMSLDSGVGICGKDGQSVPVGVGQPTLRIDAITVGGTAV